jgi:hypothetical protein
MYRSKEILKVFGKEMLKAGSDKCWIFRSDEYIEKGWDLKAYGSKCPINDNSRNIASC